MQPNEQQSPFAAQVGHWKADVSAFFNNDWCRLRTLIQNLENESWGSLRSVGISGLAETTSVPAAVAAVGPQVKGVGLDRNAGALTRAGTSVDRLAYLSLQIERRLQHSRGAKERGDADA